MSRSKAATPAPLVEIPWGPDSSDTATLLLAAAEEMDRDPQEVRTVTGAFLVPKDIADRAEVGYNEPTADE
ncbi:MAG TPA: hypothetical protein VIL10_11300 [Marmoricola sp.]|jgi:hypothetical protein